MEENRKNFDKIDELLKSTSSDKRIKFDINDVESVKGPELEDAVEVVAPNTVEVAPIEEAEEIIEDPVEEVVENIPVEEPQGICIIDETSTTVIFEEGPDMTVDELVSPAKAKKKKEKGKIKFKPVQIVIMAILALATLWCIFFTVDHTLAAQGISPVFSKKVSEYEDGSVSYKGLGYKAQFRFDRNGALTQKVCPFWEEGPNDIAYPEQ